jgi:lipid-A-disaccharide synthase
MNLAIISGEMSGDLVGGALAREIRALRPDISLWGIGSRNLRAEGVELLFDSAAWSGIGIVQSLKIYPRLRFTAYPHVLREIARRKPAAVVLIDFGAFNVKVARWCAAHGFPVMWYFPPGSWRRRGKLKEEIARITKRVVTPFPWSAERLKALGANAEFVGHPLLEIVRPALTKRQFAERFGMDPSAPIVGLLPGSRGFEVECNTPAMLGAARLIYREMGDAQFVFGAASERARDRIEQAIEQELDRHAEEVRAARDSRGEAGLSKSARPPLPSPLKLVTPEGVTIGASDFKARLAQRRLDAERAGSGAIPPLIIAENLTWDVMAHSDALIVCSGTATLEAALLGTPMAIIYRGTKMMEVEAKVLRINPEHIGLPNIIADRRIVPEFIQDAASPEALADCVLKLLRDVETRAEAREALAGVRSVLAPPPGIRGSSARAAEIALELAGSAGDRLQ